MKDRLDHIEARMNSFSRLKVSDSWDLIQKRSCELVMLSAELIELTACCAETHKADAHRQRMKANRLADIIMEADWHEYEQ